MRVLSFVKKTIDGTIVSALLKIHRIQLEGRVVFNGIPRFHGGGNIIIGEGSVLNSGKRANIIGGDRELALVCNEGATLRIGKNVGISNCAIICNKSIAIEDNVRLGGVLRYMIQTFTHLILSRGWKCQIHISRQMRLQ